MNCYPHNYAKTFKMEQSTQTRPHVHFSCYDCYFMTQDEREIVHHLYRQHGVIATIDPQQKENQIEAADNYRVVNQRAPSMIETTTHPQLPYTDISFLSPFQQNVMLQSRFSSSSPMNNLRKKRQTKGSSLLVMSRTGSKVSRKKRLDSNVCKICGQNARSKRRLRDHIEAKHYGKKRYRCVLCGFRSGYKESLATHVMSHEPTDKRYELIQDVFDMDENFSLTGNKVINHSELTVQAVEASEDEINQESQEDTFTDSTEIGNKTDTPQILSLKNHQIRENTTENVVGNNGDEKTGECSYASTTQNHDSNIVIKEEVSDPNDPVSFDENEERQTIEQNYESPLDLHVEKKHEDLEGQQIILTKSNKISRLDQKENSVTSDSPLYLASTLPAAATASSGKKHLKCTMCEFKTGLRRRLHDHIDAKHLGIQRHKCPFCSFKSSYTESYQKHVRDTHHVVPQIVI